MSSVVIEKAMVLGPTPLVYDCPPPMVEYGIFLSYWYVGPGHRIAVAFLECIAAAGSRALVEFVNGRKSSAELCTILTGGSHTTGKYDLNGLKPLHPQPKIWVLRFTMAMKFSRGLDDCTKVRRGIMRGLVYFLPIPGIVY